MSLIRALSPAQAARPYPVQLTATVAFYDPGISDDFATFFVQDATGGIFVEVPSRPLLPLHEGTSVEITGTSDAGAFAPIVKSAKVRVLGESSMPLQAPLVSLRELMDGSFDSQWVQVEGIVHAVTQQGGNIVLSLATPSGLISATAIRDPGAEYLKLVDAQIRVYAVAASKYNQNRQLAGVHLFIPSSQDVTVLRFGPADPFLLPRRFIGELSAFEGGRAMADRAHLRGTVTLQHPGQLLCIRDRSGGLCADTSEAALLPVGTVVDLVGFRALEQGSPKLTDAVIRRSPEPARPPAAIPVSSADALQGNATGQLVEISGQVAGVNADPREPAVLVSSEGLVFSAVLPPGSVVSSLTRWRPGSKVLVRGICSAIEDHSQADQRQGLATYNAFRLLMRSPEDLTLIQAPSWWTPLHAIITLSAALGTALTALLWAFLLHRQVRQQSGELQQSEQRYRHLALHDPLTGLPNRAMLQQRLNTALAETTQANGYLALMVLDMDNFKQINDSLGHDAGDKVLRAVAQRLNEVIRKSDMVARMGGDEFVALLLDLPSTRDACYFAERILEAMSSPLSLGATKADLSCSIGISILEPRIDNAHSLTQRADAAMYQAKTGGRNQYRLWEGDSFAVASPGTPTPAMA